MSALAVRDLKGASQLEISRYRAGVFAQPGYFLAVDSGGELMIPDRCNLSGQRYEFYHLPEEEVDEFSTYLRNN